MCVCVTVLVSLSMHVSVNVGQNTGVCSIFSSRESLCPHQCDVWSDVSMQGERALVGISDLPHLLAPPHPQQARKPETKLEFFLINRFCFTCADSFVLLHYLVGWQERPEVSLAYHFT